MNEKNGSQYLKNFGVSRLVEIVQTRDEIAHYRHVGMPTEIIDDPRIHPSEISFLSGF